MNQCLIFQQKENQEEESVKDAFHRLKVANRLSILRYFRLSNLAI